MKKHTQHLQTFEEDASFQISKFLLWRKLLSTGRNNIQNLKIKISISFTRLNFVGNPWHEMRHSGGNLWF